MNTEHNPIRFWSITSGISLLVMAVAAGFAYGISFSSIYVENNPALTLENIQANSSLYYAGAITWCLILMTDLIVSYGFYRYLKPTNRKIATSSGILRFIYSIFLAVGIVLLFLSNTDGFLKMWSLGLFIIGFHLIVTGIGAIRTIHVPNILGVLLIIAGLGYSVIHGLSNFLPWATDFAITLESILAIPMTIGELSFGTWLLIRGGKSISQQPSNVSDPGAL